MIEGQRHHWRESENLWHRIRSLSGFVLTGHVNLLPLSCVCRCPVVVPGGHDRDGLDRVGMKVTCSMDAMHVTNHGAGMTGVG